MKNLFLSILATILFSTSFFGQGTGEVNPKEFGELHNKYLEEGISYVLKNKSSIKDGFISINLLKDKKSQSVIFDEYSNLSIQEKKDIYYQKLNSKEAISLCEEIDNVILNSNNYYDIDKQLTQIEGKVNKNLKGKDWDIVMVVLETTRHSSYFWLSKDLGGSGLGDNYINYIQQSSQTTSKKLPGWVRSDGAGAGLGMVAWGFSGLFVAGPVGGGAGFLYGAISGAVTSSMTAHVKW